MVSIVSNSAALVAATNLQAAATESQSSIARLSSGNAIVQASDNVAGLAIGTELATAESTLKTVLTNSAQASSLLGIANGGLTNISDILQQQQSLATQANSGSLSDTERSFLNQEFQSLTAEVNQIVSSTTFNGISLLDGSISGSASATTATGAANETYGLTSVNDFSGIGTLTGSSALSNSATGAVANQSSARVAGSGLTVINSLASAATQATSTITVAAGSTNSNSGANLGATAGFSAGVKATQTVTFAAGATTADTITLDGTTFTFTTAGVGASNSTVGIGSSAATAAQNFVNAVNDGNNGYGGGTSIYNSGADTFTATLSGNTVTITANQVGNNTTALDSSRTATATVGNGTVSGAATNGTLAGGAASDSITLGSDAFTFVANGTASSGTAIQLGTNLAGTLNNIVSYLNTASVNSANAGISGFTFSTNGSNTLVGTSNAKGASTAMTAVVTEGSGGAGLSTSVVKVDGVAATDNANTATTYQASLLGSITNVAATYNTGAIGTANNFTANNVTYTATVGGVAYQATQILSGGTVASGVGTGSGSNGLGTGASNNVLTFYKVGQGAGVGGDAGFTLDLAAANLPAAGVITDQSDAAAVATAVQSALTSNGVAINQTRALTNISASAAAGTDLAGLKAGDVTLTTGGFSTSGAFGTISPFTVTNNSISATINGQLYTADLTAGGDLSGSTTYSNTTHVLTYAGGGIILKSADNATSGDQVAISFANLTGTTADLSTGTGQSNFASALNAAVAVGSNDGLSFQVGASTTQTIGVSLGSASTSALYLDDNGDAQTLDISTATDAQTASAVLTNAINTVTALQATVGALEQRFNYATANVNSSIQNTDSARSTFLDTDVASESTNFATEQVKEQASISVLAQANQLPQNLLKLIG